ncbi:prephenate dehydratase [Arcobacter sp. LA11]|uniref:prephenate dehydratase n=1 Tax=Arcobacter sp. LA11 TaxID=1898176 RepID=UPI000933C99E|nr:prephenate dehydratase [Arcobacter sp. LA11]
MNKKTIAYQGVRGAYSHLACNNVFPDSDSIACETFQEAMSLVEKDEAHLAMIPVENSTAGRVEEIYRLIPKMELNILDEHFEPVKHCLLGLKDSSISDIKYVSSHPQALAQCHVNITNRNIEAVAKFDTAGAAQELTSMRDKAHGAIASSLSAELYDLNILDNDFGDHHGNTTRFLILSKDILTPEYEENESYITSLVFEVRDIPSSLYKALGGFATNGVNLIKLESYSLPGSMKATQFHIDIDGHTSEKKLQLALEELKFFAKNMKQLGVYKRNSYRDIMKTFND